MPTSKAEAIPHVAALCMSTSPDTILEIGVGFGKYGVLFREWCDARFGRIKRDDWKTKIHGIEIFDGYRNPAWSVYDQVFIGNIIGMPLPPFDFIFAGDVIEHLQKEQGFMLLELIKKVTNKCCVVVVPLGSQPQDELFGNPAEAHISTWNEDDFYGWQGKVIESGGYKKGIYWIRK